MRQNEGCLFGT